MKIPGLGKIAGFLLKAAKPIALSLVVKAVASDKVSLSKKDVTDAIEAEAMRQVGKRLGEKVAGQQSAAFIPVGKNLGE